jgi:NAD(P)-dependent dehydrogenase (short-subunit alcohol dehydrogenase family)
MKEVNLILGGTHGLGAEIAADLQARGEETFVTGRSYNEAEHGAGMQVDLASEDSADFLLQHVQDLGDVALKRFFWVAASPAYVGDFATQPNVRDVVAINVGNVIQIAQAAWRLMIKQKEASDFVIVSSTTGVKVRNNETTYGSTKAFQVMFAHDLRAESERLQSSVNVSLVMPGGMQTPWWDGQRPAAYDEFLDPKKVAAKIYEFIHMPTDYGDDLTIERGSL